MVAKLRRSMGPWQASSLVVGCIIGTGIFLKTSTMTQQVGSYGAVMAAWVLAGILSYAGALTYAELSARFPNSGGEYVFLKEAYGPLLGFLYGWVRFWIGSPGSIAAYAVGAATFSNGLGLAKNFPGGIPGLAVTFVLIFSAINCAQVVWGARVQTFLTALKVALILFLPIGALFFAHPMLQSAPIELSTAIDTSMGSLSVSTFGLAMIAALWAFDGWNNLPMVGEEIENPGRNLPIALGLGVLGVLFLYLSANWAYFQLVPLAEIVQSNSSLYPDALPVATKAAKSFLGDVGVPLLSIAFVISALGAMNGSILTGARVPYAMAGDGLMPKSIGLVSSTTHVPIVAVLVQAIVAIALALTGTFDQLTDWVVVASWLFYALCISTLFVFRKRQSAAPAFQVPGFPVIPILFILASLFLIVNSLLNNVAAALSGAVLVAAGVPVFYFMRRTHKK
jgi:APA family basic amino acid/polyamine antiporter